jgi:TldD protein
MPPVSPFTTAEATLLAPNEIDAAQLDGVFGQLATHQIDDADLYFQYTRSEAWSLEEGQVKSGSFNIDQGVGVRAVVGDKTAFAYSDDIRLPAILEAAATVRAIAAQRPVGNDSGCQSQPGPRAVCPDRPARLAGESDKVALLHRLEDYARKLDARVTRWSPAWPANTKSFS